MTLARAFRNSGLNTPSVPISAASLAEWLGGSRTRSGALVSEQRVLGLPAYYRAMAIRSGVEAALPLKIYERGTRKRVRTPTVLDNPNPGQYPFQFRQTMKMNEIGWGNAYALKKRNGADVVVQVRSVHPSKVRAEPVDETDRNPQGKLFLINDRHGIEHRFTSWEVMHIPFMSPDGLVGVSAFQAFRDSLGNALAAEDTAGALFANGIRPSGIISTKKKLNEVSAGRLKKQAQQKMGGTNNAGEILILDDDATWINTMIPPNDAELLQSRQWSVTEISRMVGVMPHMIGDTERSTSWGSGIESQFLGWVQTTVLSSTINTEQVFTGDLLPGGWEFGRWFCEHSFEGLLRGDSAARAAFYAQAIQWGWLTRNEVRLMENREEADGLDEFIAPSNMTIFTIDGTPVPLAQGAQNAPLEA